MTAFEKSETLTLDTSREIRDQLLKIWGPHDADCLGHAWDGVVWGRIRDQRLDVSDDENPGWGAQLRWETLLDFRIFCPAREFRLWRNGQSFSGIFTADRTGVGNAYFRDQSYELIRSPEVSAGEGHFVELKGLAGQRHYPPGPNPARLKARLYYQACPQTGLVRCIDHRLLELTSEGNKP